MKKARECNDMAQWHGDMTENLQNVAHSYFLLLEITI